MKRILVIDDEAPIRALMEQVLTREGYGVISAPNGKNALEIAKEQAVHLVITDIIMPDKEGLETIRELTRELPDLPIIAMSGGGRNSPEGYLATARILGADAAIEKPIRRESLLELINTVLE